MEKKGSEPLDSRKGSGPFFSALLRSGLPYLALLLASSATTTTRRGLLSTPLSCLGTLLAKGEHRVNKVHVGVNRLLSERLPSLRSPLLLFGQLLAHLPSVLCLGTKVLYHPVEELLSCLVCLRCCSCSSISLYALLRSTPQRW